MSEISLFIYFNFFKYVCFNFYLFFILFLYISKYLIFIDSLDILVSVFFKQILSYLKKMCITSV